MIRAVCIALLLVAPAAQAQSRAMTPEVKGHWDRALQSYAAKDYEGAITELSACFELDPRREFLFAWAQAERMSGDCPSAVVLYRRYLDLDLPPKQADAARKQLARCTQALSTRPEGAPGPEDSPTAAEEAPRPPLVIVAPPPPPPPKGPWYKDVAGDALLSAGVVSLGAGGSLYFISANSARQQPDSYGEYAADTFPRAERQRTYALVGLGLGLALTVAALARYLLR